MKASILYDIVRFVFHLARLKFIENPHWRSLFRTELYWCTFLLVVVYIRCEYRSLLRRYIISPYLNLDPNGAYYSMWKSSSYPIKVKLSFFDVTNAAEVLKGDELVKVREVGHFVFHQYSQRLVDKFSDDLRSVFYFERNLYFLDTSQSASLLDQNITVPNLPLLAVVAQLNRFDGINNYIPMPLIGGKLFDDHSFTTLNKLLAKHNESLFIHTTPRQLIFGYKLSLGDVFAEFMSVLCGSSKLSKQFKAWFTSSTGDDVNNHDGNFSLFGLINSSLVGPFEIYTGLNGSRDMLCRLRSFQGFDRFDIWKEEACNLIKGNDISVFPFDLKGRKQIQIFLTSACRTLDFVFEREQFHKGLLTHKYTISPKLFKSAVQQNKCYCTDPSRCRWNGLLDIGPCYGEIPFFISKPYFNQADIQISEKVQFTVANKSNLVNADNESYLLVHPLLGTTLYGNGHFQLSLRISNQTKLNLMKNINGEFFVPFVKFSKNIGIDEVSASKLLLFCLYHRLVNIASIMLIIWAILQLLYFSGLIITNLKKLVIKYFLGY